MIYHGLGTSMLVATSSGNKNRMINDYYTYCVSKRYTLREYDLGIKCIVKSGHYAYVATI